MENASEPTRAEVDAMQGPVLLELGASWCPHCQRARPLIDDALSRYPEVRHIRIEDGKGRRLGRSFQVKLWPTLVFMQGGEEVARLVRPIEPGSVAGLLDQRREGG